MRKTALGALAVLLPGLALAQTSPFVDAKTERPLLNELSGDLAFETLRITTQWHKPSGSEGFFAVAREVEARAKAAGPPGRALDRPGRADANWTCRRAEAWLLEGPGAERRRDQDRLVRRGRDLDRGQLAPGVRHGRARRRRLRRDVRRTTPARTCAGRSCSPTAASGSSRSRPSGSAAPRESCPGPRRA